MNRTHTSTNCSIVAVDKFIQATRDSGYKGTSSAVSELVDNAIQANATFVSISVEANTADEYPLNVAVLDDGCGMDPFTLREALRFGGSTRFDDRGGLGRYGMGLPNSSMSQARRVTVYTWQTVGKRRSTRNSKKESTRPSQPRKVFVSHLDVDEIVQGKVKQVPKPRLAKCPPAQCIGPSGTLVVWTRCDRCDNRRVSTITRKLATELGRRFRHFLWNGVRITINGESVKPIDPLCLHRKAQVSGARLFGEPLRYEIRAEDSRKSGVTGWVQVRFSELPIRDWFSLSNDEKRRIGVSKGAGVSVVRAGREVDHGWFFMGGKRRENYDDWWRCEIYFEPVLDEAFGITHTKQQIRPSANLLESLAPDIESMARVLNSRVRKAHGEAKATVRFSEAERLAATRDHLLQPLCPSRRTSDKALMKKIRKSHPRIVSQGEEAETSLKYHIVESTVGDTAFFTNVADKSHLVVVLNPDHPFYRDIYKPLVEGDSIQDQQLRVKLELLLLSAARAEATIVKSGSKDDVRRYREEWSDNLATFLNG